MPSLLNLPLRVLIMGLFFITRTVFADTNTDMKTTDGMKTKTSKQASKKKNDQESTDPCKGLLALLDRPTQSDSPCVVKAKSLVTELGYTYLATTGDMANTLNILPQMLLRFGLGHKLELRLFVPSYMIQNNTGILLPHNTESGFSDAGVGVKYELGHTKNWIFGADTEVIFPTGSSFFSAHGTDAIVNGIAEWNVTSKFTWTFQLGVASLTARDQNDHVVRFTSVNPDIVFTNQFTEKCQVYVEWFARTDAGPGFGFEHFISGGLQYLIKPKIEIDVEAGHSLNSIRGAQITFVGFGAGFQFH